MPVRKVISPANQRTLVEKEVTPRGRQEEEKKKKIVVKTYKKRLLGLILEKKWI